MESKRPKSIWIISMLMWLYGCVIQLFSVGGAESHGHSLFPFLPFVWIGGLGYIIAGGMILLLKKIGIKIALILAVLFFIGAIPFILFGILALPYFFKGDYGYILMASFFTVPPFLFVHFLKKPQIKEQLK